MTSLIRRSFAAVTLVLLAALGSAACSDSDDVAPRRPAWEDAIVEKFATLPLQDRGRIKPLSTWASYLLLRLNNRSSFTTPWDEKLEPTAWLLDCLFYPEVARDYEVFLVANREALDAIGLHLSGKKRRDRYSFAELYPARQKLNELGRRYVKVDAKERTLVEGQIVALWENFLEYWTLDHAFDFTRARFSLAAGDLSLLFDGKQSVTFSEVLGRLPALSLALRAVNEARSEDPQFEPNRQAKREAFKRLFDEVQVAAGEGHGLALFPASESRAEHEEYLTAGDVLAVAANDPRDVAKLVRQLGFLRELEEMSALRADRVAFARHAEALHADLTGLAQERGEYRGIPLEVRYYELDLFYRSLVLFVLAFVVVAFSWLFPRARWLGRAVPVAVVAPTLLAIGGIVMRCVILGRPPVTHLYETIPYITVVGILAALLMEWINRTRVAIGIAAVMGAAGMFIAQKYAGRGDDTMQILVAVLDTNFWLATHVTIINIGYAAGLLAGLIAHVWLLGKLFGLRRGDHAFYRSIGRMVYGTVCFALVFSVVGTILGGVWANDSWGRFWGWDPKENGALMIAIWSIVILHGRMGGYLRDFGISMMSVALGMVVAFSWWHVNLLGVGLHSYGFTSGVVLWLVSFYALESVVMILGAVGQLREKAEETSAVALRVDAPQHRGPSAEAEPLPEH